MKADREFSWNSLMKWRSECFKTFGSALNLPVESPDEVLKALLQPGSIILDIGAGAHKPLENLVKNAGAEYRSLDVDPAGAFDYHSFTEIPSDVSFDVITANQILEHVTVDAAIDIMQNAAAKLKAGGAFFATVPNTSHPVRQRDCTHITCWPANDIYSLFRSVGLSVTRMVRYNKHPLTTNPIKKWIVATICKEFRVDWCDGIIVVGTKAA